MSVILKAENISKQYRLGLVGTGTIRDDLTRWWYKLRGKEDPFLKVGAVNDRSSNATEDYVWALRDINFEVQKGEVLGIIGKNGAGKSTLLKLLSRVTSPTTGTIKTRGRIASLLEIGTGFHGELTGRENIFMNGAVLGMSKTEIRNKLDEIIAFSGCEKYIDTPVKRYSSGMTVRLGFAVAAHLEPEILVVDEVLAVGDAEFQKKAIGKMQDLSTGEGRTVLFVSHNMTSIKHLCDRVIVLENGLVKFDGDSDSAIKFYLSEESKETNALNFVEFEVDKKAIGIKKVQFKSLKNKNQSNSTLISMGDKIIFQIDINNKIELRDLKVSIVIVDESKLKILAIRSFENTKKRFSSSGNCTVIAALGINNLMPGKYFITVGLAEEEKTIEIKEECLSFSIVPEDIFKTGKIPKGDFIIYSSAEWDLKQN